MPLVNRDVQDSRHLSAAPDLPARGAAASLLPVIVPRRLRLLLEVQRLGSITRAAEACSIGQPTASADLRTLEAAVGRPLCVRAGRATRLTDAGRVLADHVATTLSLAEGVEQELSALDAGAAGTARVAASDGFGAYVVPAVVAAFARERPQAEIETLVATSGEVVRLVAKGEAQLGIAGPTRRVAGVRTQPLARDELVWIAPPGGLGLRHADTARLAGVRVVVARGPARPRALVERTLSRAGCRPDRVVEIDSVEGVKRAVRAGAGVAAVSRLAVADELAAGTLELLSPSPPEPMTRVIEIVRSERRKPTPLERSFEQSVRDRCAADSSGGAMGRIANSA